ncbi:MAG: hypothetical protein AAF127_02660 [Pseudomonadota bacterium]
MNANDPLLIDEIYAALDWWDAAGVNADFGDDATAWLLPPDTAPAQADTAPAVTHGATEPSSENSAPRAERINLLGDQPPADLAAFHRFWLEAPGLDSIGPRGRIAPRGPEGAQFMALVVAPEPGDTDRLLSGPQGRLLDAILAAMGVPPSEVYIASALTRVTPVPDLPALAAGGMDAVLRRHIELAKPQRVIAFGQGLAPLIATVVTNCEPRLREINRVPSNQPLLMCEGLDSLMTSAQLKRWFWRRWIEWSAQD